MRPLLVWPDWSDVATISGSTAQTLAPLANLQKKQPMQVWASIDRTGVHIDINRGASGNPWSVCALMFVNATAAMTWKISDGSSSNPWPTGGNVLNTAQFTASAYSSMPAGTRRHGLFRASSPRTAQYVRIDITDAENPDLYFRAGRLIIGSGWQFPETYPATLPSFVDESSFQTTQGGQTIASAFVPIPVASINLRTYTEADMMDNLHRIVRERGASRDVLYIRDPDPAYAYREHGMLYGLLQGSVPILLPEYGRYEAHLEIRGLL